MKTKTTKIIGVILTLVMLVSILGVIGALSASAADDLTVTIDTGAEVTLKDTDADGFYEIGNANDLYAFAAAVNSGNTAINGVLTTNIVVNEGTMTEDSTDARKWTAIVDYAGSFDGAGYTVSGLYCAYYGENNGFFSSIADGGTVKNLGIVNSVFLGNKYVGSVVGNNKGTVENCYNTGIVSGYDAVGGIAGLTWNEVQNCYNTGEIIGEDNVGGVAGINNGTLQNCYNRGPVSGSIIQNGRGAFVGGVVGRNLSLTANSYNTGTVSGERNVGGVVGYLGGRVENNFYLEGCATDGNGTVQNGLGDYTIGNTVADEVGKTEPEILANFASPVLAKRLGNAWGQNVDNGKDPEDYPILGGDPVYYGYISCAKDATLVYTNNSIASETKLDHISEKAENKATCAHAPTCDRCGVSYGSALEHSTTAEGDRAATCASRAYCSVCESEYGTTDQTNHDQSVELVNDLCPYCNTFDTEATLVTTENYASLGLTSDYVGYYAIGNTAQLYWFADKVNNENATYGSVKAVLTANITDNAKVLKEDGTLNGDGLNFRVWTPIGNSSSNKYIGTFDGNGKTVSGLYFNDSSDYDVGLFGNVFNSGTVKNVGVIDSYISGNSYVGSVVGYNYGGSVINCYSKSTVCSTAKDGKDIGGVVGYNEGTVMNCYNEGIVNVTSYKAWRVGGVVGYSEGTVDNCYNKGTVYGKGTFLNVSNVGGVVGYNKGTVKDSHNESNIIGDEVVGGVVGSNYLTVENCYNTGDIDASISGAGGVAGYNNSGSNLTNCYNEGTITGRRSGGVVARNYGTVENCSNTGDVIGNYSDIGGVAGVNGPDGKIIHSYNEGDVTCKALFDGLSGNYSSDTGINTGGVVGYNYGSVERCYNIGAVSGEGKYTGGVVGLNDGGSVQNCYNTGSVTNAGALANNKNGTDIKEGTGTCVGGVVGDNQKGGTVANCYNTAAVSGIDLVGGVVGENTEGSVSNNYYLSTDEINQSLGGINGADVAGQAESKSAAQFASGEIAYLLQAGVAIPEGETVAPEVWGQKLGTDDYPVFGGDKVYLIAYCDGTPISYSNTESDEKFHKINSYGYCVCQVKITGASIAAGVDLTMKYYVGLIDVTLVEEGQKLAMRFIMNGKTVTVYANAELVGGEYVFEFDGIAPQQMSDLIDATLVVVNENGEIVDTLTDKKGYSAKANAEALLDLYKDDAALVQLVTDMLYYGAAAQGYKDHNLENLANKDLPTELAPSEALPTESDKSITVSASETVFFTSATVWFDNVNKIGVKLSTIENVTLKVNGEAVELNGTTYYTDAIYATGFDTVYTFELYEGEALVQTLTYSVSSYVYAMMNKTEADGTTPTEMAELARALYRYGASAVAYKNAQSSEG